jgi:hypothetical protein
VGTMQHSSPRIAVRHMLAMLSLWQSTDWHKGGLRSPDPSCRITESTKGTPNVHLYLPCHLLWS